LLFTVFIAVLTTMEDDSNATHSSLDKLDHGDDDEPQRQVQQIVILGERVSGIPWL
jgi:hypothetical protein